MNVTLELRTDDAEPLLRQAAEDAAKYGALCDYITKRTGNCPQRGFSETLDDARKRWQAIFLRAKRIVESFGIEYEPTSEEETLTVDFPHEGGTRKVIGGLFAMTTGSKQNFKKPFPSYRREVHSEACRAAAGRTVRKWKELTAVSIAA